MDVDSTESPVRELLSEEVTGVSGGFYFSSFQIDQQLDELISEGFLQIDNTNLSDRSILASGNSIERHAIAVEAETASGPDNRDNRQMASVSLTGALPRVFHRPYGLEDHITEGW